MLKEPGPNEKNDTSARAGRAKPSGRTVIARYPNHVWSIDHTIVPLGAGLWVPWLSFCLPQ